MGSFAGTDAITGLDIYDTESIVVIPLGYKTLNEEQERSGGHSPFYVTGTPIHTTYADYGNAAGVERADFGSYSENLLMVRSQTFEALLKQGRRFTIPNFDLGIAPDEKNIYQLGETLDQSVDRAWDYLKGIWALDSRSQFEHISTVVDTILVGNNQSYYDYIYTLESCQVLPINIFYKAEICSKKELRARIELHLFILGCLAIGMTNVRPAFASGADETKCLNFLIEVSTASLETAVDHYTFDDDLFVPWDLTDLKKAVKRINKVIHTIENATDSTK